MATARRRRVGGRRQNTQVRKFIWARERQQLTVAAETTGGFSLLGDFQAAYGAQLIGSTVVRIRGAVNFRPVTPAVAATAAGIVVTMDGQSTVSPIGSQSSHVDWMAFEPVILTDDGTEITRSHYWDVDVRSSRKIEELGQDLSFFFANPLVGVAIEVDAMLSIGLKLP